MLHTKKPLFFLIVSLLFATSACEKKPETSVPIQNTAPVASPASPTTETKTMDTQASAKLDLTTDDKGLSKSTVVLKTDKGVIKYKFYSKDAPKTVERIAALIAKGFYNGLTFHRVVPGFVVQGGDPTGTGAGGTGEKLKAEFNSRKHVEGAVAMARAADPNSADCQFYITLGTHPHLDNNYTVFGFVTEGMDVAKNLKQGDKMTAVTLE